MADELHLSDDDTVADGASQLEDVLELSLLTQRPRLPATEPGWFD